ncbi:MAG: putative DNA-binding protein [Angelakisella sp.]|nr:putative DNA-binding protein [Angelakisella sp.]
MAKNLEISFLLDFYGDMLTEKQRDVVELYYNEDLSLAEIAAHSGITRQGVRDSIKRAESQLLEYEDRLHLAARFRRIEEVLSTIVREAQQIEKLNSRFGGATEIDRSAETIIRLANQLEED